MNEAILKYKNKDNEILEIFYDPDPPNPRTHFDNMGIMLCTHKRYSLGDQQFQSVEELEEKIKELKPLIRLPLYLMDHGMQSISVHDFNDKWDSGQVGEIIATKESVIAMHGKTKLSKKQLEKYLTDEVKIYDDYMRGNVYGYTISKTDSCDLDHEHKTEIDSCWGFFGEPENVIKEVSGKWKEIE